MSEPESTRVEVGRLGKPYGLEGGLKFRGEPVVEELEKLYVEGLGYRLIEDAYYLNDEMVIHVAGVSDRADAERVAGLKVYADIADLPELAEGEFYYFQLVGRPVFVGGKPYGEVADVEDAGAQDLLVVKASGKSLRAQTKTHLVPMQAPYVHIEDDGIHIEPIPGLFD